MDPIKLRQQQRINMNGTHGTSDGGSQNINPLHHRVVNVWEWNLREEFARVRAVAKEHTSFIAMNSEVPPRTARPLGRFISLSQYEYESLRLNTDLINLLQFGITLMDEEGNLIDGASIWQFNFKINPEEDMISSDTLEKLASLGFDLPKHEKDGISTSEFAELMICSGFVLNDNYKWLSFNSGSDVAYMVRILLGRSLPESDNDFLQLAKTFFPVLYDVRYITRSCKDLTGGLLEVVDQLDISKGEQAVYAGSGTDSFLTAKAFFKIKEMYFEDSIDETKYGGHLYGFRSSYSTVGDLK